ncbi:unnamed protein product [Ectocarpus sp. CCAP 1310/34]|nr:unnamed protein product [Ectocarpus sp. CCAP 1310/34]
MAEDEVWEPLSTPDFWVLGFVATFQTVALLVCAHLLRWRKWPPYVTKNVDVVIISAARLPTRQPGRPGDILAACDFERFLSWSTLCVHTVAFFIRVYRMWRILIKHDDQMWHTGHQILFMSSLSLIPVVATWAVPHTGYFDEVANTCSTTTFSTIVVLGMDALGFLAICYLWFVCARQLKWVRKQFNEYETMKRTLLYMTITLASYGVIVVYLLADNLVLGRRVSVFYPLLTTYILLWGSIREPFMMKILGDDEYLWSYTKGFAQLPSPAQLKASLAEQLSVDQLRDEFRRYIKTKVAQELIDFYLDSLDREEVADFFERQAATMRIVDQYIKEGARDQVNVSGACREKILATDVTAFDIFDEARAEVLAVMETNFRRDFVTTEGFRRILNASKQEQRELRLLRAGGMLLPLGTPSPGSSYEDKTPSSSASPHTAAAAAAMCVEGRKVPPPRSPGLVRAFRSLPYLVRNAKAASESWRRRAAGRSVGARVGGAATTVSIESGCGDGGTVQEGGRPEWSVGGASSAGGGARSEGEGKGVEEARLALGSKEEDAAAATGQRLAPKETDGAGPRAGAGAGGGSTAYRDVEMAERGGGDADDVAVSPGPLVRPWSGGDAARHGAGGASAVAGPCGGIGGGDRSHSREGGGHSGGGGRSSSGKLLAAAATGPGRTTRRGSSAGASSLACSSSASLSEGSEKPVGSDDTPSTDSLRGLYVKSRSDPAGLARSNKRGFGGSDCYRESGGGGGGREPAIVELFGRSISDKSEAVPPAVLAAVEDDAATRKESSHSTAAAWTGQFAGAASRAGQTNSNANRLYRGGTGNWSSGGVPRVEFVEDSPAAAPARPGDPAVDSATNPHRPQQAAAAAAAGATDPQSEASVVLERDVTAQQLGLRLAALAAAAGAGPSVSDNAESGGGGGGGGYGDLEVGVEGLDTLSSWPTDESPDWVRFSDWIRNGSGPAEGEGAEGAGGANWMWDVNRGLSLSDGGSPETGRRRRSWGSGGSSWSKHSEREF